MHTTSQVFAVLELARSLGIGEGEACDRAGIARSTPSRWKNGTVPRAQILRRLHMAIIEIAKERNLLTGDGSTLPAAVPDPAMEVVRLELENIRTSIARIDAALGIVSGA